MIHFAQLCIFLRFVEKQIPWWDLQSESVLRSITFPFLCSIYKVSLLCYLLHFGIGREKKCYSPAVNGKNGIWKLSLRVRNKTKDLVLFNLKRKLKRDNGISIKCFCGVDR